MTTPFWRQLAPQLEALFLSTLAENLNPAPKPRQTIERYVDENGVERVQQYWAGLPFGRPWFAWMWDSWDEPTIEDA